MGLLWNDSSININWNVDNPILSEKDTELPKVKDFNSPF